MNKIIIIHWSITRKKLRDCSCQKPENSFELTLLWLSVHPFRGDRCVFRCWLGVVVNFMPDTSTDGQTDNCAFFCWSDIIVQQHQILSIKNKFVLFLYIHLYMWYFSRNSSNCPSFVVSIISNDKNKTVSFLGKNKNKYIIKVSCWQYLWNIIARRFCY